MTILLWCLAVLGAIGGIPTICIMGRQMYRWWWPGKESWKGYLLNALPRKGKESDNWKFDRPQQVRDYFLLDIQKAPNDFVNSTLKVIAKIVNKVKPWCIKPWEIGKARVIDRIQFMQGDYPPDAYPKKYAVTLQGLHGILPDWERREQIEKSFGENIIIELKRPEKILMIVVEIIEPRLNQFWAVGEIRIREVRLFGKFWKVKIK
jgi:hypothetical protein